MMGFFDRLFNKLHREKKDIDYNEVIGEYSKLMDPSLLIRKDSDLPAPKEVIQDALRWANTEPMYRHVRKEISAGLLYLDHFISDDMYDTISPHIHKAMDAVQNKDDAGYKLALSNIPEEYHVICRNMTTSSILSKKR